MHLYIQVCKHIQILIFPLLLTLIDFSFSLLKMSCCLVLILLMLVLYIQYIISTSNLYNETEKVIFASLLIFFKAVCHLTCTTCHNVSLLSLHVTELKHSVLCSLSQYLPRILSCTSNFNRHVATCSSKPQVGWGGLFEADHS